MSVSDLRTALEAAVPSAIEAGRESRATLARDSEYLEFRALTTAFNSPSSSADPDWGRLEQLSLSLAHKTPDLQVYAFLCHSLFQTRGYSGLESALEASCRLVEQGWQVCLPARRQTGVLKMWGARLASALEGIGPIAPEHRQAALSSGALLDRLDRALRENGAHALVRPSEVMTRLSPQPNPENRPPIAAACEGEIAAVGTGGSTRGYVEGPSCDPITGGGSDSAASQKEKAAREPAGDTERGHPGAGASGARPDGVDAFTTEPAADNDVPGKGNGNELSAPVSGDVPMLAGEDFGRDPSEQETALRDREVPRAPEKVTPGRRHTDPQRELGDQARISAPQLELEVKQSVRKLVAIRIEADATDPIPYRMARAVSWSTARLPNSDESNRTRIPTPPPHLVKRVGAPVDDRDRQRILVETEALFMTYPLWLDLQHRTAGCLDAIGAAEARKAVETAVVELLERLPTLVELTFAGGLPFASPETRTWLKREKAGRRPLREVHSRSAGAGCPSSLAQEDSLPDNLEDALAALGQRERMAPSGHERFLARLQIVRMCLERDCADVTQPFLDLIEQDIERHELEGWSPELVAEASRLRLDAMTDLPEEKEDARNEVWSRLCRLDPATAISRRRELPAGVR